jgi:uncharacterized protein
MKDNVRITQLSPSHYRKMPWKNGQGVTTELARSPRDGEFDWRLSVADVRSDGPFSSFPGYDRVILALSGMGMLLSHLENGCEAWIGRLEPYAFPGDWTTTCELHDGPIRDFNVMTRRGACTASVTVLRLTLLQSFEPKAPTLLLYGVEGDLAVHVPDRIVLAREQTLLLEEPSEPILLRPQNREAIAVAIEIFTDHS